MGCSFPQLCSHHAHAAFAFCQAEPALYFHTLAFVAVILCLIADFTLSGSAQCRAGQADPACFAVRQILARAVDFIG